MNRNGKHPDDENWRDESENHRVGREIYRDKGNQPYNDQYRSSQNYHNRNEGYGSDQTHYGARPNSAYRNPDINFGNNGNRNHNYNNMRYDNSRQWNTGYQQGHGEYLSNPPREYPDNTRPEQHHDHRDYTERNWYKDTDYRYRSGNRGDWHTPGSGYLDRDFDNNDNNRNNHQHSNWNNNQNYNRNNQNNYRRNNEDEGFFNRMGNGIREAWNNLTHPDGYEGHNNYRPSPRNYETPRGYESGPRWADESETDRFRRESQYRRDQNDY